MSFSFFFFPPSLDQAISCKGQHSISYTLSRNQTVVVEYTHDNDTDMFQVGRSTESPIDFVVTDTVSGGQNDDAQITQSTISRFACRIVCDRNEPYTARIFAAGFDSSKNIFLGVSTVTVLWFQAHIRYCDRYLIWGELALYGGCS